MPGATPGIPEKRPKKFWPGGSLVSSAFGGRKGPFRSHRGLDPGGACVYTFTHATEAGPAKGRRADAVCPRLRGAHTLRQRILEFQTTRESLRLGTEGQRRTAGLRRLFASCVSLRAMRGGGRWFQKELAGKNASPLAARRVSAYAVESDERCPTATCLSRAAGRAASPLR